MAKKQRGAGELEVVEALFARSITGVFAHQSPSGVMTIRYPKKGPWPLHLGLAVRLQNEAARAAIDTAMSPLLQMTLARYKDQPIADLQLATTDHLIAELYRIIKGNWVFGLFRPKKQLGHWSGLCWNGSAVGCAGVASVLVQTLQADVFTARLKNRKGEFSTMGDVAELAQAVFDHAERKIPSKTWMAGVLHMAEHVIRQSGRDGLPGDDLASFVRID